MLSLDWIDLGGTLSVVFGDDLTPRVVSCSADYVLNNGWSKDYFTLPKSDLSISSDPDLFVVALLEGLGDERLEPRPGWPGEVDATPPRLESAGEDEVLIPELAAALRDALSGRAVSYAGIPHGWSGSDLYLSSPLDYLGRDGGVG